ncbi:MAG: SAM-dependent methyltransferase [Bacilli bacterium]|jgi:tRNA (adenine22-N1)-methyltransferase|nr:SAM-dependent methyltransferase [Bacilli bacterium]
MNLKLKTIANFVKSTDTVIDTCCDHAYLAIYLKENNMCKEVFASDISEQALNGAIENIKNKGLKIKTFLSDGFKDIYEKSIDTAIIAGVGTSTALSIVASAPKNIQHYIISSNNNYEELRTKMYEIGYFIQEEFVVEENDKFYPIMRFERVYQRETKYTLMYGKSNNKNYYRYLLQKEEEVYSKLPKKDFITKFKHSGKVAYLQKLI